MERDYFPADAVGRGGSTLHPDPHRHVPADIERMLRVAAEAGFPSFAIQLCNVALATEEAETMAARLRANAETLFRR